jgi:hypothetical protein
MFQRMGWTLVDYVALTGFLIWAAFVIFGEEAKFCAAHVQEISDWWYACLIGFVVCIVYDLFIVITCSIICPIVSCLFCYLHAQGRNTEAERARAIQERMPIVQSIVERLNTDKKKFTNLSTIARTQTECCICTEAFTNESEVSELLCNEKHIFHTTCLTDWMRFNTICPLCKSPVQQQVPPAPWY